MQIEKMLRVSNKSRKSSLMLWLRIRAALKNWKGIQTVILLENITNKQVLNR